MEKAPIKKFAVEARRKLIADVTFQLERYGITEKGIVEPQTSTDKELVFDLGNGNTQTIKGERYVNQYRNLAAYVRSFYTADEPKKELEQFIEEIAFTWFNRLVAIRFMEVNRYLPVRVLSSEIEGQKLPDLVASPFSGDLEFTDAEKQHIFDLQDANKEDDLFRFLFFKQCKDLSRILPRLFENLEEHNSFSELLVVLSFNDPNGVVYRLVHEVKDPWFDIHAVDEDGKPMGQVQIFGWMYQYYNTEPKDKVFADLKKNIKISKQNIPAATQLFTPDWIVCYMVENSLGRLWVEGHPGFDKSDWKYYLDEAPQEPQVEQQLQDIRAQYAKMEPEQLKVIDPCMGSGHILCYLFDVLMQIYLDNGYSKREAVRSILENNLFGLDIDKRATQIAYFSVMMKAREYDSGFFGRKNTPQPRVYDIQESNWMGGAYKHEMGNFLNSQAHRDTLNYLLDTFIDAKEYGSILQIKPLDYEGLKEAWDTSAATSAHDVNMAMWYDAAKDAVAQLIEQAILLSQKYDVVVTNPPYMGASNMNPKLNDFIKKNYADYKSDFFSSFVIHCSEMTKKSGYCGFFTPYVWMFIQSYEKMRNYLYTHATIETLIQFEYSAFEEATVPVCTFALQNRHMQKKGCYLRLVDFRGGMEVQRQKTLEAIKNHNCGFYYEQSADNFAKIPGSPVAYWVRNFSIFDFKTIGDYYESAGRNKTHNNELYVRNWWEISNRTRWQPYANGGVFRRWAGNDYDLVDWSETAKESYALHGGLYNQKYNGKRGICWNLITSYKNGFKIKHEKHHYSSGAPTIIASGVNYDYYVLAYLNCIVSSSLLNIFNPTLNTTVNDVLDLPLKIEKEEKVECTSQQSTELSQNDWDSFETSWDFKRHPLIKAITKYPSMMERGNIYLAECYDIWAAECEERFTQLKANEEELNRIFIDIYGLQDELTPEVEDKDVTVRKADLQRDVKSLLSYAVGCLFGRYAPETDGLMYAGGAWDESRYHLIHPVKDNVLPLCDEEYFGENDLVNRVVEFIKEVFGASSLEDNLAFIAKALGNKGNTSREIIRNYFLKDFFADHCKIYQKRPIYWMFDSGKKNGFKALVYLHRWDADTTGRVYNNYLSPLLRTYAQQIVQENNVISSSHDARTVSTAQKRLDKLKLQQEECEKYEKNIAHLAALRITLDLDDGVKVNYVKAQTAADGKNLNVLVPIK